MHGALATKATSQYLILASYPSGTDIYYYCLDVSNIMSFLNGQEETEQGYTADTWDLLETMGSYKFAIHQ